jgi:hypothetical protein
LIRLCGDGVVSNEARNGSFTSHGKSKLMTSWREKNPANL